MREIDHLHEQLEVQRKSLRDVNDCIKRLSGRPKPNRLFARSLFFSFFFFYIYILPDLAMMKIDQEPSEINTDLNLQELLKSFVPISPQIIWTETWKTTGFTQFNHLITFLNINFHFLFQFKRRFEVNEWLPCSGDYFFRYLFCSFVLRISMCQLIWNQISLTLYLITFQTNTRWIDDPSTQTQNERRGILKVSLGLVTHRDK